MALYSKVALDTNMLLSIATLKVDVFGQVKEALGKVQFLIPKEVEKELEEMASTGLKQKKNMLLAAKEIKENNAKILETETGNADSTLLKLAEEGVIVATNDRELRKRLKKVGGRVIFLRKKKYVEME